jgi:hypothetical protein
MTWSPERRLEQIQFLLSSIDSDTETPSRREAESGERGQ